MKKLLHRIIVSCTLFTTVICHSQIPHTDFSEILEYRSLGPYRVGSWISSIAVPMTDDPAYAHTFYIAGRNGGVWKTINSGTTFSAVFDSTGVSSIGAVAISPSHPDHVWVGTGEAYNARSTHAGNGIYFSPDSGKTWEHKGLEETHHISTVIVHPDDPETVFVASMGHLFTPNEERGIFKTTDGGNTWKKVLFIDENTGIIDMIMNPEDPHILYAAAYEKYRYPWHFEAGGENSGIFKSVDGGDSWDKLSKGLAAGKIGRIGLALCYNQPEIVYAVIENLNPKPGIEVNENIAMNHMRDPYYDQLIGGEVYRSLDGGSSWENRITDSCNVSSKAAYSFNKIMVSPDDPEMIFISSDVMLSSEDGGKTWLDCSWPPRHYFTNMFGDIRTFWVDPKDGRHMMIGSDGGLYITWDGGKTVTHYPNIPLGEIYIVETDDAEPYNIYVGLQDHDAWKGPSNSWSGRIGNEDWNIIGLWDGMYTRVDPQDNRWVYVTTQFGAHHRVDQYLGERVRIEPQAAEGAPPYRFCWTTPLELSPHNSQVLYTGGQMLLRSLDRGDHWEEISPDLTTNDSAKIAGKGHMMYCTITSISESSVKAGVIWVGTDDGRVHLTKDHGKTWTEMTDKIAALGGKRNYWVTRVVASPHDAGKAYVCKSGYKNDDFSPMVFNTTDFGSTWTMITKGLSEAPVNVIAEDPNRKDLLYLGNDHGVFISFDGGLNWQSFRNNMPVVPVKDLKVHPRENDLVIGTYGRGAYIANVSLIQQISDSLLLQDFHLFDIKTKPVRNFSERAWWGNYEMTGDNQLFTPNEDNGLIIYYHIKETSKKDPWIEICDSDYKSLDTLEIDNTPGLHKTRWFKYNLEPGTYRVRLHAGKSIIEKKGKLEEAPVWPVGHCAE